MHERALAIREQTLAAEHPDIAVSLSNLGGIHQAAGRYREALQLHERALAMREKVLGAAHHEVGVSLSNIGDAKLELRDARSARAHYTRALAVFEKALGHDHPHVAYALTGLAEAALALRQPTEARDAAQRAFAIRERARVSATELGTSLFVLARTLWAIGSERRRALDLARQAAERFAAAGAGARKQLVDVNAWLDAR